MTEAELPQRIAGVEQWIAEARQGSRRALDRLVETCRPYLLVTAHRELGAAFQARVSPSDVVQETLMEAWQDFQGFQGRTEKDLLAWLRQILLHNVVNEHRRHVRTAMRSVGREAPQAEASLSQLEELAGSPSKSPNASMLAKEQDELLERALEQLPPHYRQALLLHTGEGLTFAEVGKRLHCSAEASRKLWSRAAEELARLLGEPL